eukprot:COSAG02_NODE_1971_length_10222_cov_11.455399_3_plen_478_part_00
MFAECVAHVESLLCDSFTTINASFDNAVDLECAVSLYRTIAFGRHDVFEEVLYELLITGVDRVIDGVLCFMHVTAHSLHTLLRVVEYDMNEFDTTFRDGLPEDIPERVMRYMLERCRSALLDTQACVGHDWEDALAAYYALLELIETAQHLLQQPWLNDIDLQSFFAPTFEAFVVNNQARLCEWASQAVVQDTWEAIDDTNLHSSSVNDLVQFLLACSGDFESMTSLESEAKVLTTVMIHYCERVAERCEEVLGIRKHGQSRSRSKSLRLKAKEKVAAQAHVIVHDQKTNEIAEPEHEFHLVALCVGINNIYMLGETHAREFSIEPTRIMASLAVQDVADAADDVDTIVAETFLQTHGAIRKVWCSILNSLVDAQISEMENILVDISEETKTEVWDAITSLVGDFLEVVCDSLYEKAFHRLLRQLCCGSFAMLERALCGRLKFSHAPISGDELSSLIKGLADNLSEMYSAGFSSEQL